MASRTPTLSYASGASAYLRMFNMAGQWFDFADNTFKTSGTGTTPYLQATYDATEKIYRANSAINFANVWNKGTPTDFVVLWYNNAAPVTGDSPITDGNVITLQFGEFDAGEIVCQCDICVTTTAGVMAHLVGWLERDGQRIVLAAGTCTITLRERGGVDLFAVTNSSPTAGGEFEMTKATPNFTSDRVYFATVEITENSKLWTTKHTFKPIG